MLKNIPDFGWISEHTEQLSAQGAQIIFHNVPEKLKSDAFIVVGDSVSESTNFDPWNICMPASEVFFRTSDQFANLQKIECAGLNKHRTGKKVHLTKVADIGKNFIYVPDNSYEDDLVFIRHI